MVILPPYLTGDPTPIPRYHSKAAYSVNPEKGDAIIEASTYQRKEFRFAVPAFPPREHDNVVTFVLSAFREPTTALRELDRLPLEHPANLSKARHGVTLRFRQTNTRARQIILQARLHKM
jgi:hypothetical protein